MAPGASELEEEIASLVPQRGAPQGLGGFMGQLGQRKGAERGLPVGPEQPDHRLSHRRGGELHLEAVCPLVQTNRLPDRQGWTRVLGLECQGTVDGDLQGPLGEGLEGEVPPQVGRDRPLPAGCERTRRHEGRGRPACRDEEPDVRGHRHVGDPARGDRTDQSRRGLRSSQSLGRHPPQDQSSGEDVETSQALPEDPGEEESKGPESGVHHGTGIAGMSVGFSSSTADGPASGGWSVGSPARSGCRPPP